MSIIDSDTADMVVDHLFYSGRDESAALLSLLLSHKRTPVSTLYTTLKRIGDYGLPIESKHLAKAVVALIEHSHGLTRIEAVRTTARSVPGGLDLIMDLEARLGEEDFLKTVCYFEAMSIILNDGVTSDQSKTLFEQKNHAK